MSLGDAEVCGRAALAAACLRRRRGARRTPSLAPLETPTSWDALLGHGASTSATRSLDVLLGRSASLSATRRAASSNAGVVLKIPTSWDALLARGASTSTTQCSMSSTAGVADIA
jgi:hypothetical protein